MSTLWQAYSFSVLLAEPGTTDGDFLTYADDLSRVRIDQAIAAAIPAGTPLNSNTGFEVDTSGWFASGGTLARSTAQHHTGVASGLLTPDGVTATAQAGLTASGSPPVAVGQSYAGEIWVYSPTGYGSVAAAISWLDAANAIISTTTGTVTAVPAGVWTRLLVSGTAPAGAVKGSLRAQQTGTPPATATLHIDDATIAEGTGSSGPVPPGATRVIERSTDEIHWTTVRGGDEAAVDAAGLLVDDFEFAENTQNTYRIRVLVDGDLFWTFRDQITVALDVPWLKSISFPFLNRPVDNSTAEPRVRPSRSGVFPVVGRSLAVAVTDVRGGPQYNLTIATATDVDRVAVEAMFAPGDVMLLQVPPTAAPGPGAAYPIPGGYYAVGDITEDPRDMPWDRRWWLLPLTKVAPPAPSITGATITWRGLGNRYATLADMKAANATWRDVLELQGTPQDVVIP